MLRELTNKVAIVTEAGTGIGRTIALRFAWEGVNVVDYYQSEEAAKEVTEQIRS